MQQAQKLKLPFSQRGSMRDEIFGSWSLERFDIVSPEGVEKPWGENVSGLLIYSKDGHMSVSINRALNKSEPNEAKAIFDSILFYSGTFQIDGNVILHQVTPCGKLFRN